MIFDLDPPGDDFEIVREIAFKMRELLAESGKKAFLKTTGRADFTWSSGF